MKLDKNFWLFFRPIAHRGLWNEFVVENSITAYERAIAHNYPIEIDLFLTKDGHLVCFHDDNLERMTGVNEFIYNKTLDELKGLSLNNTHEKIPTFDEVLELCEGKTPLLIEIKNQPNKNVVKRVVSRLKDYKGEFAIQSFNPFYINEVRKLAPNFVRGVLGSDKTEENLSKIKKFVVKNMPFNFICKPHFISFCYTGFPLKNPKNLPTLAWTITSQETADYIKDKADNIIFENFIPK